MTAVADPQVLVARFAAAVLGLKLGRDAMVAALQGVSAQGAEAAADRVLAMAFAGLNTLEQARVVTHNLGLQPRSADVAEPVLAAMFDHAGAAGGQALLAVLQGLADGAYSVIGPEQTRLFNLRIEAAQSYAEQRTGDAPFRAERPVALTPDADVVQVGPLEDLVVGGHRLAGASTWTTADQLYVANDGLARFVLELDAQGGPMALPLGLVGYDELVFVSRMGGLAEPVRIDAGSVQVGVQRSGFQHSQADVLVDPMPAQDDPALRETTIRLEDTAAGSVDHAVYFRGLAAVQSDATQVVLELMDTRAATSDDPQTRARPLKDSPFNGFAFLLDGDRIVLKDGASQDTDPASFNGAQTHDELLHAVQLLLTRADNLARWPALAQVTAALGPGFDAVDTRSGQLATGTGIVLSVPAASGLVLKPGNVVADDGTTGEGLHTVMTAEGFRRTEQPAADVVLDHAGQGLAGGDLVIGGSAADGSPYAPGITRFEITVERDSALGVVAAADGRLQEVVVRNGAADGGLKVQGWDQVTSLVGGAAADGDTAGLPGIGAAHGAWGFTDVRLLDLSGLRGPASVDAVLTASAHQRYANQEVSYLLGSGNDHLALVVQGASASMRLRVAGGPGNDHIELATGAHSVELAFGPGFGDDRIVGFDSGDRLDFGALGGTTAGRVLTKVPALQSLPVVDGQVDRVEVGAAVVDAASVAARYIDGAGAVDRAQVVVTSQGAQAQVWQVVDPAGAGNLSVTLAGSLTLDSADWMLLMPGNFG